MVGTQARTNQEAVDLATENLDFLRGIWNYALNRRKRGFFPSGVRLPKSMIIRGPFSKLYLGKRPNPTDGIWTNDSFSTPTPPAVNLSRAWQGLMQNEQWLRSKLKKNPLGKNAEYWIREYGRALDLRDYNIAYLALWRIIEQMSGLAPRESHIEVDRRVSFLFIDTNYNKLVLSLLRNLRNEAVHSGQEISCVEDTYDELRGYVEILLDFYIRNPYRFKKVSDVVDFLSLAPDPSALEHQIGELESKIKLRKYALRFHRGISTNKRKRTHANT